MVSRVTLFDLIMEVISYTMGSDMAFLNFIS